MKYICVMLIELFLWLDLRKYRSNIHHQKKSLFSILPFSAPKWNWTSKYSLNFWCCFYRAVLRVMKTKWGFSNLLKALYIMLRIIPTLDHFCFDFIFFLFKGFLKLVLITQSTSKTIITRSMLTISLIVFTDKLQGHILLLAYNISYLAHLLNSFTILYNPLLQSHLTNLTTRIWTWDFPITRCLLYHLSSGPLHYWKFKIW